MNVHMHAFHDMVSISIVPLMGIPLCTGIVYGDATYMLVFLGALAVGLTTNILKVAIGSITRDPLFYRPRGALFCTLLNGKCDPRAPAFPSGHVSVATFLTIALYRLYLDRDRDPFTQPFLVAGACVYIVAVAYSRYAKRCHNVLQIVGGFLYGVLSYFVFVWCNKE